MTTKMIQSDSDTLSYLSDLAEEGKTLHHGIEVLVEKFELPPLRQQVLAEAAEQLGRVIHTLESVQ